MRRASEQNSLLTFRSFLCDHAFFLCIVEPDEVHNIGACAPSRLTSQSFWIARLIKRKVSIPPALAFDARSAVGHPDGPPYLGAIRSAPL